MYNLMSLDICKHHDMISTVKVIDISNTSPCFLASPTFFVLRKFNTLKFWRAECCIAKYYRHCVIQQISSTYSSTTTETVYLWANLISKKYKKFLQLHNKQTSKQTKLITLKGNHWNGRKYLQALYLICIVSQSLKSACSVEFICLPLILTEKAKKFALTHCSKLTKVP